VTGGSRGVGAATVLALARRGFTVMFTYRNKARRADAIAAEARARGASVLSVRCDITRQADLEELLAKMTDFGKVLHVLVLNASGGLERDLIAADPQYPMRMNRDAQLAVVDRALPFMTAGGVVIFVTSHWAHLFGQVEQLPAYGSVAASKHAGEEALRARQRELAERGIRLIVVTGDLVEGTITAKLLERATSNVTENRRRKGGTLPTPADMGDAIAIAATDPTLPNGHTVVVGGALESI
jgi:NAD(P)-dependent dehydrogenase (short-subunit alcohol dehydrogenase family)